MNSPRTKATAKAMSSKTKRNGKPRTQTMPPKVLHHLSTKAPRKAKKTRMTLALELVTPKDAYKWLMSAKNIRKKKRGKIEIMAQDMLDDTWEENGASVKFRTERGKQILVDGQNRLEAIILSNTCQYLAVARNCQDSKYVDIGERRTLAQILKSEGAKYANETAGTVGNICTLIRSLNNDKTRSRIGNTERFRMYDKYKRKLEKFIPMIHNAKGLRWRGQFGAILCVAKHPSDYRDAAQDFISSVATGRYNGQTMDALDPCQVLHDLIIKDALDQVNRRTQTKLALVIKCWNQHCIEDYLETRHLKHTAKSPFPSLAT